MMSGNILEEFQDGKICSFVCYFNSIFNISITQEINELEMHSEVVGDLEPT